MALLRSMNNGCVYLVACLYDCGENICRRKGSVEVDANKLGFNCSGLRDGMKAEKSGRHYIK